MILKELLKDKADCYATDKVDTCNLEKCSYYWTCKAYRHQLKIKDIKNREDILKNKCR